MRLFILFSLITFACANLPFLPPKYFGERRKLNCEYAMKPSNLIQPIASFYSCTVKDNFGNTIPEIIEAIGTHQEEKSNDDVNFLIFENVKTSLLPSGIEKIFENILELKVSGTGLRNIAGSELKPFENLLRLTITKTEIFFLEKNLFEGNQNLEAIDVQENMILFIDAETFTNLPNLKILLIRGLACDFEAQNAENRDDVDVLIIQLHQNCGDELVMQKLLTNLIENSVKDKEICKSESLTTEATTLKPCDTEKLNETIVKLEGDLSTCGDDKKLLQDKVEECENKIYELNNPINGTCRFKDTEDGYTCSANKISIKSSFDQKISWTGTHLASKENSNVESLLIKSQETQLLPLNIGATFTNLKTFIVDSSNLKKLKKNDFKTLENLLKLSIVGNEISSIESGTFDILTKLTSLDLSGNKILSFPSKAFQKLKALEILNLSDNKINHLRSDVIAANNKITNFYAKSNPNLRSIEMFLVWRLDQANVIDFTGTSCDLKYEKDGQLSFNVFLNKIIYECN